MKPTYEEARKSINEIIHKKSIQMDVDGYIGKALSNDMINVLNFIEQFTTPTFKEVEDTWEEVDETLRVMWWKNKLIVREISDYDEVQFMYNPFTNEYTFNCSSIEMLNAINLTIRYLQAKEKDIYPNGQAKQ